LFSQPPRYAILLIVFRGEDIVPDKREKTISYRRAVWLEGVHGLTLEKCLKDALRNLKTVDERTVIQHGQHKKCLNSKDGSSGGVFLHFAVDTPGEYASVVPKAPPGASELDLGIVEPPADGEWLDGDAFLFIRHDHMCMCTTALRDAAISTYLYDLFKKAEVRKDSDKFDLQKIADVTKLKMLHSQGVR
jgi:hypothetical protein